MEVDHFDPRKKKDLIQDYDNLFPASRTVNGKKWKHWPNKAEERAGCRFLNPCEEMDYDEQIFEDPMTHKLVGANHAATWHIRFCGLNADPLVTERAKRAKHWETLNGKPVNVQGDLEQITEIVKGFREEVELMIPPIKPPP